MTTPDATPDASPDATPAQDHGRDRELDHQPDHQPDHQREHELSAIPREARAFQGQRAGVVTRAAAATVDGAIIALVVLGIYLGYAGVLFLLDPRSFAFPDPKFIRSLLVGGLLLGCYTTLCWAATGRTYGNLLLGLRVVSAGGGRVGWVRSALRSAFYVFVPIGLFWVVVDRRLRSVQDLVLHTAVVYDWQPRAARYRPEP